MPVGQVTAHETGKLTRDRQSQAPGVDESRGIVGTSIGLEDAFAVLLRYQGSTVANQHTRVGAVGKKLNPDMVAP